MAARTPPLPTLERVPPLSFFAISAIFHYLGPSFAVLLFAKVDVLGVALLRIWSAALVFALWRRPWQSPLLKGTVHVRLIVALGIVLAAMNAAFYLAIARLPLATVGAIEFLGVIVLAAVGTRTPRNFAALLAALAGVAVISHARIAGDALGLAFAFTNCALFVAYLVLAHRISRDGGRLDGLAAAMSIAAIAIAPFALRDARPAFEHPLLLAAGAGVGISSSLIPYVTDQLAMARLPRASFALMLSSLPAVALVVGAVVLRQFPTIQEFAGIACITIAIAAHRPEEA